MMSGSSCKQSGRLSRSQSGCRPIHGISSIGEERRGRKRIRIVDEDLLSSLPESMICHIFSFMPIKDIMRTSVLSKSWRFMWYETPAISFDCPSWIPHLELEQLYHNIDRVLNRCTSSTIQKFHLLKLWYDPSLEEKLDVWLQFSIERHAEDICLELHDLIRLHMPVTKAFFRCQSVVKLHMNFCSFSSVSNQSCGINWTSLKVLHIELAKVGDDVFDQILNGSPLLEYLKLSRCSDMNHLRVNSRKLRELVVDGYSIFRDYPGCFWEDEELSRLDDSTLVISAPHLLVLRLLGDLVGKTVINLDDVSSLVECELNFTLMPVVTGSPEAVVRDMLKRLLPILSRMNKLVLGNWFFRVFPRVQSEDGHFMPIECRNLVLRIRNISRELEGIANILKCTLYVENLAIDLSDHIYYSSRVRIPLCDGARCQEYKSERTRAMQSITLPDRLRRVEVLGFRSESTSKRARGPEVEWWLSLISMLLKCTPALEEMVINLTLPGLISSEKKHVRANHVFEVLNLAHRILRFPRSSDACEVILNYPFMEKSSCSHHM